MLPDNCGDGEKKYRLGNLIFYVGEKNYALKIGIFHWNRIGLAYGKWKNLEKAQQELEIIL